jgi:hypothetical protein
MGITVQCTIGRTEYGIDIMMSYALAS